MRSIKNFFLLTALFPLVFSALPVIASRHNPMFRALAKTPSAGGGGLTTTCTGSEVFCADFNNNVDNTTAWDKADDAGTANSGTTGLLAVTNTQLEESVYAGQNGAISYTTKATGFPTSDYDVRVRLKSIANFGGTTGSYIASLFRYGLTSDTWAEWRIFSDAGGTITLAAQYKQSGGSETLQNSTAYSATSHQWLRIARSNGTGLTTWYTAPDNGSGAPGTWTALDSLGITAPSSNPKVMLQMFRSNGTDTGASKAVWDDVRIP